MMKNFKFFNWRQTKANKLQQEKSADKLNSSWFEIEQKEISSRRNSCRGAAKLVQGPESSKQAKFGCDKIPAHSGFEIEQKEISSRRKSCCCPASPLHKVAKVQSKTQMSEKKVLLWQSSQRPKKPNWRLKRELLIWPGNGSSRLIQSSLCAGHKSLGWHRRLGRIIFCKSIKVSMGGVRRSLSSIRHTCRGKWQLRKCIFWQFSIRLNRI